MASSFPQVGSWGWRWFLCWDWRGDHIESSGEGDLIRHNLILSLPASRYRPACFEGKFGAPQFNPLPRLCKGAAAAVGLRDCFFHLRESHLRSVSVFLYGRVDLNVMQAHSSFHT